MGNCVYKWITLQNYRKKKHFCCSEKHKRVRELAAATMAIQCLSSSLAMAFPSKLSTLSINSSSTPLTLSNSRSLSFSSSLSHNSFSKGTLNSLSLHLLHSTLVCLPRKVSSLYLNITISQLGFHNQLVY